MSIKKAQPKKKEVGAFQWQDARFLDLQPLLDRVDFRMRNLFLEKEARKLDIEIHVFERVEPKIKKPKKT